MIASVPNVATVFVVALLVALVFYIEVIKRIICERVGTEGNGRLSP